MPPAVFETATPVSEEQQAHALDRVATGIGRPTLYKPSNLELH